LFALRAAVWNVSNDLGMQAKNMAYTSIVLTKYEHMAHSWTLALRTGLLAALVNSLLYAAGVLLGVFSSLVFRPVITGELTIGPVLIASFLVPIFAFIVFVSGHHFRRMSYRTFRDAAWLAVIASLLLPLTYGPWTIGQVLLTQLMHMVAGGVSIYAVSQWAELAPRPVNTFVERSVSTLPAIGAPETTDKVGR
jgi:hypothetical protein